MSVDTTCHAAREWLSAFRDGETLPDEAARTHVDDCRACAAWEGALDAVTRRLVLRPAGSPNLVGPALDAWHATSAAPSPRQREIARLMLVLAGVAGLGLAIATLAGAMTPDGSHFVRDLVAFEIAVAIGFLLGAWRPDRFSVGLLPVAGVAGLLTLLVSARDVPGAEAAWLAEASHIPVLLGMFGLFVLLDAMNTTAPRRRRIA
jgi:predicted anti-sigma-YlaC factor YlaD